MSLTKHYHHARVVSTARRESICAMVFSIGLIIFMASCLFLAFSSSGPLILGTEMNANGMVEYLCLGNGCENMTDFRWRD